MVFLIIVLSVVCISVSGIIQEFQNARQKLTKDKLNKIAAKAIWDKGDPYPEGAMIKLPVINLYFKVLHGFLEYSSPEGDWSIFYRTIDDKYSLKDKLAHRQYVLHPDLPQDMDGFRLDGTLFKILNGRTLIWDDVCQGWKLE